MKLNRPTAAPFLMAGLGLLLALGVVAAPAAAKVKVKDGAYYQNIGNQQGVLMTAKGKITSASGTLFFRQKGVGACTPDGLNSYDGLASFSIMPKRPVNVKSNNRFSLTGAKQQYYPKLKTSVSGRFISSNRARFTVKAWQGACKGSITLKKAKYTAGG